MASIQFDGTEILDTDHIPQYVKHETAPDRILDAMALARVDGDVFISERRGRKVITLRGILRASTQAALDADIDEFKELFARTEKNLDISWGAGTRRYVATCTRHEFDRDHYHTNGVPWAAEFVVLSGLGYDTSTTEALDDSITTVEQDDGSFAYEGSFTLAGSKAPLPVITLTITDADSDMLGVEFRNIDNDERIIITRDEDWDGAVLVIDCFNKRVTFNDAEVAFSGVFPTFKIGTNNYRISSGGLVNQQSSKQTLSDPEPIVNFSSTNTRYAQSFIVPYGDDTFQAFRFGLSRATVGGDPGGHFFCLVKPDDGSGQPDMGASTILSITIPFGDVPAYTDFEYILGAAAGEASLDANTRYWLVIGAQAATGSEYYVAALPTDNTYPRGQTMISSDAGSTFSPDGATLAFQVLFGGIPAETDIDVLVEYTKAYL